MNYNDFIKSKIIQESSGGFDIDEKYLNKSLFDYQKEIVIRACKKGKYALFVDTVFSPFNGIGSEGYCSVKMNRKYIGAELKKEYFDVAIDNLKSALNDNINLFTLENDDDNR